MIANPWIICVSPLSRQTPGEEIALPNQSCLADDKSEVLCPENELLEPGGAEGFILWVVQNKIVLISALAGEQRLRPGLPLPFDT